MELERMPGDAEAAAAIEGMADTYGKPAAVSLPAVGDRITYRTKAMTETEWEAGRVVRVQAISGRPLIVVEAEDAMTLRVIDARPWPDGNVLPF